MAKHFWFSFTGERTPVDTDIHDAVKVKSCCNSEFIEVFTFVLFGQSI